MLSKWLAASAILGALMPASGRADVSYRLFDAASPSQVDLSFSVASQLTTNGQIEAMTKIGGVDGVLFVGQSVDYLQTAPTYLPDIMINFGDISLNASFDGFSVGNPANGAPGNGSFQLNGEIFDAGVPEAILGSATIAGVPVTTPEPCSLALLSAGLLGMLVLGTRFPARMTVITFVRDQAKCTIS